MTIHALKRRMSALTTVLGLGITLPFALATPAEAASFLEISKSHEGDFARGGQGLYNITLDNTGPDPADSVEIIDNLPAGLTVAGFSGNIAEFCQATNGGTSFRCDNFGFGSATLTLGVTVNVANNTPCSVVNTVTATAQNAFNTASDSDQTTITGGSCSGGGDDDGNDSILPINLNGVVTLFNNITTNNNFNSPGASNTSNQNFGLNAP